MEEYNPIRKKAGECIMKELELLQADQTRGDSVAMKLSTLLMAANDCNFLRSECTRPMTPAEKEARLKWVEEQAASIEAGEKEQVRARMANVIGITAGILVGVGLYLLLRLCLIP